MEIKYKIGEKDTRPWGEWEVTNVAPDCITKRIIVNTGGILSLQRHKYREEFWVIINGQGQITLDDTKIITELNHEYHIPKTIWHRIENIGNDPLVFIETQKGEILDENDIERKEDKYNR